MARSSAVKARSQTTNQLKALLVTAPAAAARAAARLDHDRADHRLRPVAPSTPDVGDPEHATKTALRRLARRHQFLSDEISDADAELHHLVTRPPPP